MFQTALFSTLGLAMGLFAVGAVRADVFLVALPAAVLAVWFFDTARLAARRTLRARRANTVRVVGNEQHAGRHDRPR